MDHKLTSYYRPESLPNRSTKNDNTTCSIRGIGTAVPSDEVAQEDALEMSQEVICEDARQARLLKMIFNKSGVETRRTVIPWQSGYEWKREAIKMASIAEPYRDADRGGIVASIEGPGTAARMSLYRKHAPELAIRAAEAALSDASVPANSVTHLVTVSCTGFDAPGVDIRLIKHIGLSPTVQRVNVGFMGCHGAINGMRTVRGLTAADPGAVVLLVCVELCSLHYRMTWDDEGMIGNALFADGAAAIVATGLKSNDSISSARSQFDIVDTAACLVDETESEMSWSLGDHGFVMNLTGKVSQCIEGAIRPWIETWLASHGHEIDTIVSWVIHPGGPRILDACQQALELPETATDHSREILRTHGNMSSPTILFVLERIRQSISSGPVVMLAFGPGLMAEAALLESTAGRGKAADASRD